jgi:GFO/IDH/MocA oxidoreductase family protein
MNRKKIGFIDLFIDEWHANHFPEWLKTAARGSEFELFMAYEKTNKGGRSLEAWCKDNNTAPAASIAEVVEKCDCLFVLAPSNPEVHYELAELALASGKPTYIDKPFASDFATAQKIFKRAEKYNTPVFSSSALRFSNELINAQKNEFSKKCPNIAVMSGGGGNFNEYIIHMLEPIVAALGTGAKRLMVNQAGFEQFNVVIGYDDERMASASFIMELPYNLMLANDETTVNCEKVGNFFENFADTVLEFFATSVPPVAREETLEIAALLECAIKGRKKLAQWVDLPEIK